MDTYRYVSINWPSRRSFGQRNPIIMSDNQKRKAGGVGELEQDLRLTPSSILCLEYL